jgi:hypothetical protein
MGVKTGDDLREALQAAQTDTGKRRDGSDWRPGARRRKGHLPLRIGAEGHKSMSVAADMYSSNGKDSWGCVRGGDGE